MQKKDIIYFLLVGLCIVLLVAIIFFIKAETSQCLKNPFVYGAKKMGDVSCSCTQFRGSCPPMFSFNTTTFVAGKTECGSARGVYPAIDFGNLSPLK